MRCCINGFSCYETDRLNPSGSPVHALAAYAAGDFLLGIGRGARSRTAALGRAADLVAATPGAPLGVVAQLLAHAPRAKLAPNQPNQPNTARWNRTAAGYANGARSCRKDGAFTLRAMSERQAAWPGRAATPEPQAGSAVAASRSAAGAAACAQDAGQAQADQGQRCRLRHVDGIAADTHDCQEDVVVA